MKEIYLTEKAVIIIVQMEREKIRQTLMIYVSLEKNLKYLRVILNDQAFEYIFLTYRPSIDYIDENFPITNFK